MTKTAPKKKANAKANCSTRTPLPELPDDALACALNYASRGWRVVPIAPGFKYPKGMPAWPDLATTDPATIKKWWGGKYKGHGVGIATGPGSGLLVIDVDTAGVKVGDESLADLEAKHGKLPDTVEAITGSGGRHLVFRYPTDLPDGVEIGNVDKPFGPDIDIRGEGGQIVVAPTIHPDTKDRYLWEASTEEMPAELPAWAVEMLVEQATSRPPREKRREIEPGDEDRPGTIFEKTTDWAELLVADGARFLYGTAHTDDDGEEFETWQVLRPPMQGETIPSSHKGSASLNFMNGDVLKVFSTNWGGVNRQTGEVWHLKEGETYTRFGYFAVSRFGGDHKAAAAYLGEEQRAERFEALVDRLANEKSAPMAAAEESPPPDESPDDAAFDPPTDGTLAQLESISDIDSEFIDAALAASWRGTQPAPMSHEVAVETMRVALAAPTGSAYIWHHVAASFHEHKGPGAFEKVEAEARQTVIESAKTGGRKRFLRGDEIFDLPEPVSLIDGYPVPEGGLMMIYGHPKSLKTFIALSLSLSVATGTEWLGHEVPRAGKVLYVIAEGARGIQSRVDAWKLHHGVERIDEWYAQDGALQLDEEAVTDMLDEWRANMREQEGCEAGAEHMPTMIVLDTFARCTVGLDENSARDMGEAIHAMDLLQQETGATVVAVHHSPKAAGAVVRGSSAILGATDVAVYVKKESGNGIPNVVLDVTAVKDFAPPDKKQVGFAEAGKSIVPARETAAPSQVGLSPSEQEVAETLYSTVGGSGDWLTRKELVTACEAFCTSSTVDRCCNRLTEEGCIELARKGRMKSYRITDPERYPYKTVLPTEAPGVYLPTSHF